MTAEFCSKWNEILNSDSPYRASLEGHLSSCSDCTKALAGVALVTSRLASWSENAQKAAAPPSAEALRPERIGPILAEQRQRDLIFGAFVLYEFAAIQIAGGAFGSHIGNVFLGTLAVAVALIVGVRWVQRRSLLKSFGTDTLLGHLRVTTRAAERRTVWVAGLCMAFALLNIALIPFARRNPMAIVPWLAGPGPRLTAIAIGPALFSLYTWFVTRPRAIALRREVE